MPWPSILKSSYYSYLLSNIFKIQLIDTMGTKKVYFELNLKKNYTNYPKTNLKNKLCDGWYPYQRWHSSVRRKASLGAMLDDGPSFRSSLPAVDRNLSGWEERCSLQCSLWLTRGLECTCSLFYFFDGFPSRFSLLNALSQLAGSGNWISTAREIRFLLADVTHCFSRNKIHLLIMIHKFYHLRIGL